MVYYISILNLYDSKYVKKLVSFTVNVVVKRGLSMDKTLSRRLSFSAS